MVRFNSHTWTSALQERLERESMAEALGTMRVPAGEAYLLGGSSEHAGDGRLVMGPYGASPLSGLHFDAAEDTAAS